MGYETKVILRAIILLMKRAKSLEEAIQLVTDMANAESIAVDSEQEDE